MWMRIHGHLDINIYIYIYICVIYNETALTVIVKYNSMFI